MEIINKGRPVYISYAHDKKDNGKWKNVADIVWNDDTGIVKLLEEDNIEYKIDKNDCHGVDNLSVFEREVAFGECIIVVFSDKYFHQPHTMYEWSRIRKSKVLNPNKLVCYISVPNFKINDDYITELNKYWSDYIIDSPSNEIEQATVCNGFYLEDINALKSSYNNTLHYNSNNYKSLLIREIKDFYTNNPTPITNSSEIFYKFDKDMWKNFVFSINDASGTEIYMIPNIIEGLKDEDQSLFKAMIDDLIKDSIINRKIDKKRLDVGGKELLTYWNKKGIEINLNSNCLFYLEYYQLMAEAVRVYEETDTKDLKDCRSDFAGVFDNILRKDNNNKGWTSLIS